MSSKKSRRPAKPVMARKPAEALTTEELDKAQGGGLSAALSGGSKAFTVSVGPDIFFSDHGDSNINDQPLDQGTKR